MESRSALVETMNPGVQKPHWIAPWKTNAFWMGWRLSGVPIPSMVVIVDQFSIRFILTVQERTSLPSRMTLQAPHVPVAHPTLTPVRWSCFRSTSDRSAS